MFLELKQLQHLEFSQKNISFLSPCFQKKTFFFFKFGLPFLLSKKFAQKKKFVQIFYLIRVIHIVQVSAVYSIEVTYEWVKMCVFSSKS